MLAIRLSTNTLPNQNLPPVLLISEQEKFKEGELFREYVHARRLGSMELMFLLLGGTICNSSVQINLDDDELHWKSLIKKYLAQPNREPLDNSQPWKLYVEKKDKHLDKIGAYEPIMIITLQDIIKGQLENIKILPQLFQTNTGSGKSFLVDLFAKKFSGLNKNFFLMAPTGVAATNVQGQTIQSRTLKSLHYYYEASMVQASLLTFTSEMFSGIHQIFAPFGGINVILIG
nr:726_t:CDS:2 [Entrophospora candida]